MASQHHLASVAEEVVHNVNADQVALLAREWVQNADAEQISEAYATAAETPDVRPSGAISPELLKQLLTQVEVLQADVAQLREPGDAPTGPTSSTTPVGALQQAKALAGPPPKTRAKAGTLRHPQALKEAAGVDLDEDDEEEAETPTTDDLLKTALAAFLGQQAKTKKTRAPGLLLAGVAEDSEEEEADPLRRLAGAKGTMLSERLRQAMEQEPKAYVAAMESLAAQLLGEHAAGPATMERFCREMMPLGTERSLGYMTWGIARAITLLRAGESEKSHLVLMLLLAAVEQYRLDGNWGAAWRLTHLGPPPFADWRSRDFALAQLKIDHAHSRLIHPTWAAAVIARLKDEEALTKRRQPGMDREQGGRPPRGRGRGRGTSEAPKE